MWLQASKPCRGTSRDAFIWPKAPPSALRARRSLRRKLAASTQRWCWPSRPLDRNSNPGAVNPATGAKGLMQIMPRWHQDKIHGIGGESSLMLIAPNISVGAAIMAEYLDAEDGDIQDALGHYLGTTGAETYVRKV